MTVQLLLTTIRRLPPEAATAVRPINGYAKALRVALVSSPRASRSEGVAAGNPSHARQSDVRAARRRNLPRMSELVTFPQRVDAGNRYGTTMYGLSFLGVELLRERHGIRAMLDYFRRFDGSDDRIANFTAAFGQEIES